jgi:hypothetical protein
MQSKKETTNLAVMIAEMLVVVVVVLATQLLQIRYY